MNFQRMTAILLSTNVTNESIRSLYYFDIRILDHLLLFSPRLAPLDMRLKAFGVKGSSASRARNQRFRIILLE